MMASALSSGHGSSRNLVWDDDDDDASEGEGDAVRDRAPDSEGEVHEEEADKRLECVLV
jgi:hypothetical protein